MQELILAIVQLIDSSERGRRIGGMEVNFSLEKNSKRADSCSSECGRI